MLAFRSPGCPLSGDDFLRGLGGLDRRVPVVAADHELRRLVDVINGMLARLESSFEQAVRFSSDAAHELQTPLTVRRWT